MAGTHEGGKKAAAHRDPEELREAGRKGGQAVSHESHVKAGKISAEKAGPEGMAERGRKGGQASHGGRGQGDSGEARNQSEESEE